MQLKIIAAGAVAALAIAGGAVGCGGGSSGNSAAPPAQSQSAPVQHPNMAALRAVRAFDVGPTFVGTDFTSDAWVSYIAPLEKAADIATDDTLKADILDYHNDLLINGSDGYNGQALTDLINYGRAAYHYDVFPWELALQPAALCDLARRGGVTCAAQVRPRGSANESGSV